MVLPLVLKITQFTTKSITTVKVSNKKPQLKSNISQFNQLNVFIYTGHLDKATSKNNKIDKQKFTTIPKTVTIIEKENS